MSWCFAIVNKKLAEIYFDKSKGRVEYLGHCYVSRSEYKAKEEKKWIKRDTVELRLIYRLGRYRKID